MNFFAMQRQSPKWTRKVKKMKNVKNIFGAFLTMVMVAFFVCGDAMAIDACTIESDEKNEAVYEVFLENIETEDEKLNVEYVYRKINTFAKDQSLCVKETIVNSAGNEIVVIYPYGIDWPEAEDEILARFLFLLLCGAQCFG